MPIPILTIDAFTDRPFAGNPAAFCWLDEPREEAWMQAVAAELNLSETAFVGPHRDGFALRWFTPLVEVPICGHATLASAHALFSTGRAAGDTPIRFHTASGELGAVKNGAWIELDFPAVETNVATPSTELVEALGVAPLEATLLPLEVVPEPSWIFRLENESAVLAVDPDFRAIAAAKAAVCITAESDADDLDFVSRFFAPGAGVDEDPVTGFAHCSLAPFWSGRLGKTDLVGFQASGRGGTVRVRLEGERAILRGQAVTVIEGTLRA